MRGIHLLSREGNSVFSDLDLNIARQRRRKKGQYPRKETLRYIWMTVQGFADLEEGDFLADAKGQADCSGYVLLALHVQLR